jgi:hypothetical protein
MDKKEPRKGISDIASKLKSKLPGQSAHVEENHDDDHEDNGHNEGKPELTADMLEAIKQAATELGIGGSSSQGGTKIPMDDATAVKLLDYLCSPPDERAPETTNLNHVQAHVFSLLRVFEEAARNSDTIPDLTAVYRGAVYKHRRSVKEGWFAKELADLAGLQAQDDQMKNQGLGSPLGQ